MAWNILDFGATNDQRTDSTCAIQYCIDRCSESGGGRVLVPPGHFLARFLRLRSDVELYLERGAVLVSDIDNNTEGYFIYACHEQNITISGSGCIDGQGIKRFIDDDADSGYHECPLNVIGLRPRTSYFEDVNSLTVKEVTFLDAAFWTLHMAGCRDVMIDSVHICNNDRGPNNDGIDPDSCQNVLIQNCFIVTGDDAIVVKSTKNMALRYGDCENVIIRGCVLHSRDSALKIGTETYGSIRRIIMSDCIVRDCSRAIGIWSRDGGSISDILVHHVIGSTRQYSDCPQRNFAPRWWGKGEPIFISATRRSKNSANPGRIYNLTFDHIYLMSESCIFIGGEEDSPIENVVVENSIFSWKQQSNHRPELFDEQPSLRDVYKHEIPMIYGRNARHIKISGKFQLDRTMIGVLRQMKIVESCEDFVVIEEK